MATPKSPQTKKSTPKSPTPEKAIVKKPTSDNSKNKKNIIWFTVFALGWVLVSMIASQYIIALPMALLLGENVSQPLWICVYDALVYLLALVLVIFVPPALYRTYQKSHTKTPSSKTSSSKQTPLDTNSEELGIQHLPTLVDIGLAPIGYFVYIVIASALTTFMSLFSWFNADQTQDVGFSYFISGGDRIIAMLALVFIAPIAEEIIMRGWLYDKLRSKLKIAPAIILVSVLFGLLHGQWNVAVSTFALSVVLCGLREITGTIWSGVLLHMLSNGIAFYMLYIAGI